MIRSVFLVAALLLVLVRCEEEQTKNKPKFYTPMAYLGIPENTRYKEKSRSIFIDYLPTELSNSSGRSLEIRSPFYGSVKIVETAQFGISINLKAKNILDLTSIKFDYTSIGNTVLLQLKTEESRAIDNFSALVKLGITIGVIAAVIFFSTCTFLCYWTSKFERKLNRQPEPPTTNKNDESDSEDQSLTDSQSRRSWNDWTTEELLGDMIPEDESLNPGTPPLSNGGTNTFDRPKLQKNYSSTDSGSKSARKRYRYPMSQRSRDISSSDDVSSLDDWAHKKKPTWRSQQERRTARFSDLDGTSGDAGFSSSNEARKRMQRQAKDANSSLDELEWDEYETNEGGGFSPPADSWNIDDKPPEHIPPPFLEPPSYRDVSGSDADMANIDDVREAISNAMDSVNRDAVGGREGNPDSPLDDGYETGVNGHKAGSAGQIDKSAGDLLSSKPDVRRTASTGGTTGIDKLKITAVMALCLLGIVSTLDHAQITADIVIFVPDRFFTSINLYVNKTEKTDRIDFDISRKPASTQIYLFSAAKPVIEDLNTETLCESDRGCEHSCDRTTGLCVCSKGFVLYEVNKCSDRNDCLYLPCAQLESCTNLIGGYSCQCQERYWRDVSTGKCVECTSSKCPLGTYESKPCPNRECLACTTECPDNHYIKNSCSGSNDAQCVECSGQCAEDEFEYKPCKNKTNRVCRPVSQIPAARGTENLVLESATNRIDVETLSRYLQPHESPDLNEEFVRGSGITVQVNLHTANLSPVVKAIPHQSSNDNKQYNKDQAKTVIDDYCPYPMPSKYQLFPVLHDDITAAKSNTCPECPVDVRQACFTYQQFGRSAPLDPHNNSMACTEPGMLADLFDLNNYLTESKSLIVARSQSCELIQQECDTCTRRCAEGITDATSGNCSITSADGEDNWSPRLQNCQNCCVNNQCRDKCSYTRQCAPVSCWNGNVAEFILTASFPEQIREFICHTELDQTVKMFNLEYSVLYNGRQLRNFTIEIPQTDENVKSKLYSDGLLTVSYDTGLDTIPDLIKGHRNMQTYDSEFQSALYQPQASSSATSTSRLTILPTTPFAFSTLWWRDCSMSSNTDGEQRCSQSVIDTMVVSDGSSYLNIQDNVSVMKKESYTYSLWNRTRQPSIKFHLPSTVSVIRKVFTPTQLETNSLTTRVLRHQSGWKITVTGSVTICPGYFQLRVWETNKTTPISDYKVAVYQANGQRCHPQFSITFDIPGADISVIERSFRIEFLFGKDKRYFVEARSPSLSSANPAVVSTEPISEYPQTEKRSVMMIIGPFLLLIGVSIVIFSLAWIVSIVIPRNHGPVTSRPGGRAVLALLYVSHRIVYTIATTFTMFIFVWFILNSNDLMMVQSYTDGVQTVVSEQQYDLRALVDYSTQKVQQQQEQFIEMRAHCFNGIKILQQESQQLVQKLSTIINSELSNLPIRDDLTEQLDYKVRDLELKLERQRIQFNLYVMRVSANLDLQISQTLQDVVTSPWLSGAQLIRNKVLEKSGRLSNPSSTLQEWIGLKQRIQTVTTNFTMPPLPRVDIDRLALPKLPSPPQYKTIDLNTVFLPRHELYSQFKAPLISTMDTTSNLLSRPLTIRLTFITIIVIFCVLDLVLLITRTATSFETCQLILDGYCVQKTYADEFDDGCPSMKYIAHKVAKKKGRVRYKCNKLMLDTDFIPLTIGLIMIIGVTFISLQVGLDFVSMDKLSEVGLFSSLIGPWNLSSNIAAENIEMNMERINTVDIPSFELLFNHYIERIELLNNLYNNISYYRWQIECGPSPSSRCGAFKFDQLVPSLNVKDMKCHMQSLTKPDMSDMPNVMTDRRARAILLPYVNSFRRMLETTFCLVLEVTVYILIVNLISTVFWNFLTRLAIIPGVRQVLTNKLPSPDIISQTNASTVMMFSRSIIEEESHEGSDAFSGAGSTQNMTLTNNNTHDHMNTQKTVASNQSLESSPDDHKLNRGNTSVSHAESD